MSKASFFHLHLQCQSYGNREFIILRLFLSIPNVSSGIITEKKCNSNKKKKKKKTVAREMALFGHLI